MKIIDSVEIRFFRSIRELRLNSVSDLNIFSGRNDSGKSNILKALNLFFNEQTDWMKPLVFARDFNYKRHQIVRRTVKGKQFISVKVTFNRGNRFTGSLPEKFSVTRKWFRDSDRYVESDDLETLDKRGQLPSTLANARRSLTTFLRMIKYVYVPAIKDERVFQHALAELQQSFERDYVGFEEMMRDVSLAVSEKVKDLVNDFEQATGIRSTIQPPRTPEGLFRLSVNTQYDKDAPEYSVQLDLRGDGIRTRYLPNLLYYTAQDRQKLHIWGFEEPENSLEYRMAIEVANEFADRYSDNVQIFLTTHSPAFIALNGRPNVEAYRVYSREGETALYRLTNQGQVDLGQLAGDLELLHDLGVTQLQQELHKRYEAELKMYVSVRERMVELEEQMRRLQRPVLLTEGKTDVAILTTAWSKLYPNMPLPFDIQDCGNVPSLSHAGGTGGYSMLRKTLETVRPNSPHPLIGLFDRDEDGTKAFTELKFFNNVENEPDIKIHANKRALAILLPVPPGKEAFANDFLNLPIEFYFSEEVIRKTDSQGKGLVLEPIPITTQVGRRVIARKVSTQLQFQKIVDGKTVFAENIVPSLPAEEFEAFRLLFDVIQRAIATV